MLNLEITTKDSIKVATGKAKSFFSGLGLTLKDENAGCLTFEGGGGFVNVTVCEEDGKTKVQLETTEWEIQAKEFSSKLS